VRKKMGHVDFYVEKLILDEVEKLNDWLISEVV